MKKTPYFYLFCYAICSFFYLEACNTSELPKIAINPKTYCNPINLGYRFCLDTPSRREAADPSLIRYKNEYYLFASKTGGYWHSTNLKSWNLITSPDLPFEDYAPTAVVVNDDIYFMASGGKPFIYKTNNPKSGRWEIINKEFPIGMIDPCLFLDDDGHLYFYFGCSNVNPIYAVELDLKNNLNPIGKPVECINSNRNERGWEMPGDYNNTDRAPWIEGAWMTKADGKYYLQYAGPGTEYKSYADGVYVSDKPLGPFEYQQYNPFSYKPEGFVAGAGHSSTFSDNYDNFWHISTMTISVKHMFERRLGLFPTYVERDGGIHTYTRFGDFPMYIPDSKVNNPEILFPGWMLLSYNKPVIVSSEKAGMKAEFAVNEDIRTYWSAKTSNAGEWLQIDLERVCDVNSIQINFAEEQTKSFGREKSTAQKYKLEMSIDGKKWTLLVDKSTNTKDYPHDYLEFEKAFKTRYLKITNVETAGKGLFAISGFRVFGNANGIKPGKVTGFKVERNKNDERIVKLSWNKVPNAIGYNIRFGISPDKLFQNYIVYNKNELSIASLTKGVEYYFEIEAFNESGVGERN